MYWLGSQAPALITAIVFAACYAAAALVFAIVRLLARRKVGRDLGAITPAMVTPIGLIGGLLIAFLAARVWTNLDHARTFAAQEANAVRELDGLADEMPAGLRASVRAGAQIYATWVSTVDWPQMVAGSEASTPNPPGLLDALRAIVASDPDTAGQKAIQQAAVASLERVLEARRNRLLLSRQVIEASQWAAIWAFYLLLLLAIACIHMPQPVTKAFALWLFASSFALCLMLLLLNDRPFRAGGYTIGPSLMEELAKD